jgi:hypothetical protein
MLNFFMVFPYVIRIITFLTQQSNRQSFFLFPRSAIALRVNAPANYLAAAALTGSRFKKRATATSLAWRGGGLGIFNVLAELIVRAGEFLWIDTQRGARRYRVQQRYSE